MIKFLYRPIDAAILIYFRIFAGVLLSWELINGLMIGKFNDYVVPKVHFNYFFFQDIAPWPYWGMVVHYALTIFSGFAVAFNFHYRIFSILLFLGHTLLFLFEQSNYINHTYLYCLISFWMMVLPLNESRTSRPAWMLYVILFHMGLAYFFGGVAKLNPDWLTGSPMDLILSTRKDHLLGDIYSQNWAPFVFSYGGLFFDFLIVPILLFKRTRLLGLLMSIIFHLSNVLMFGLATFPWFSLLLTSMFFDPSWPRKVPILRSWMPWGIEPAQNYQPNYFLVSCLGVYALIHTALPLRHLVYPGVTNWTEEGHMFSWRMMLRTKIGRIQYFVKKKNSGAIALVNPLDFITQKQLDDLIGKPDLILQFAHHLRDHYQKEWKEEVSVYASSKISLNGRKERELIKSGTDLASEKRTLGSYSWVNPLEEEQTQKIVRR